MILLRNDNAYAHLEVIFHQMICNTGRTEKLFSLSVPPGAIREPLRHKTFTTLAALVGFYTRMHSLMFYQR